MANDGSVDGSIVMNLTNDTFTSDVVTGSHVTLSNAPTGLNASFQRNSDTQITLTLTGQADNHANSDNATNLVVEFDADAFVTTTTASDVIGYQKTGVTVDFNDPD